MATGDYGACYSKHHTEHGVGVGMVQGRKGQSRINEWTGGRQEGRDGRVDILNGDKVRESD